MGNFRSGGFGGSRDRGSSRFGGGDRGGSRGRGGFGGRREGGFGGRRERPEMFEVTCDKCKKQCEVPFKPTGDKPVYCSDCFRKNDSGFTSNFRDNSSSGFNSSSGGISQAQFKELNSKLDKILELLSMIEFEEVEEGDEDSEDEEEVEEK